MQDWFTLTLALTIGFTPTTFAIWMTNLCFGKDVDDHPVGCMAAVFVLVVAGFPLTWLVWHNFHVVWRP